MTEKHKKLKSLNIRISEKLYQQICEIRNQRKTTNSEVVRAILENEIGSYVSIFEEAR